jgi:hypothetical protein
MVRSSWEKDRNDCPYASSAETGCEPVAVASLRVRAIEELEWFGAALNRPRRLSRELIAIARAMLPRLVEYGYAPSRDAPSQPHADRVGIARPEPWHGARPHRVLAAAAFAAADAPQWPWFLRTHALGVHVETIPPAAWWRSADRFAAWAFGVSLPQVGALSSLLREGSAPVSRRVTGEALLDLDGERWIAPSIRQAHRNAADHDLHDLAIERARRAEAER